MAGGVITLGELAERSPVLSVACRRCGRNGRLHVAKLIAQHGAAMGLPQLKHILAADCPRLNSWSIYDRCGANYPELPRLFPPPSSTMTNRD